MNKTWHKTHVLGQNAALKDRLAWHQSHAKACGCRPIPLSVKRFLEAGNKSDEPSVTDDIKKALQAAGYWEKFDALSFSHRREYVQWIDEAKKSETRARRVQKMLEMLAVDK